jgi:N-acetylglucosaminyldiphosphoundecaprenol N-acetyl-beta-D-mannosaminyltransferase
VKVPICGLAIDAVRMDDVLAAVERAVSLRRTGTLARGLAVFSANVDMIVKAARDPGFAAALAQGDLLLADGVPLLWMARGLGARLPERVAGSDLVPALAACAARTGASVFLLGAAPGVADRAAEGLIRANPGLRVAGTLAPPMGFDADAGARARAADAVRAAGADVVLVALGAPRQERFILAERDRMGAAAAIAVGGALDMAAGLLRRAPGPLRGSGIEWAWRLALEPRRLARRYLVEDAAIAPLFARAAWRRWMRRDAPVEPPAVAPRAAASTDDRSNRERFPEPR